MGGRQDSSSRLERKEHDCSANAAACDSKVVSQSLHSHIAVEFRSISRKHFLLNLL